jgi:hypothetical protein
MLLAALIALRLRASKKRGIASVGPGMCTLWFS